jgi:hypothetical protein
MSRQRVHDHVSDSASFSSVRKVIVCASYLGTKPAIQGRMADIPGVSSTDELSRNGSRVPGERDFARSGRFSMDWQVGRTDAFSLVGGESVCSPLNRRTDVTEEKNYA